MGRWLAILAAGAGAALVLAAGGGSAMAASTCKPGAPLENDLIEDVSHPEETVKPIVIGCWTFPEGRMQVHGRRMKVSSGDELCLGTQDKVVCGRWGPPKGAAIGGTSCGGGNSFIFLEGVVTRRVKRVDVRFWDAKRVKRTRRASIVWLRGEVAEKLRVKKTFGYYRGETAKGAEVIETIARDGDGRVLGRTKGSSCNRPR